MLKIEFSYKRFFKTHTQQLWIPESMAELNQEQYIAVMKVANDPRGCNEDVLLSILTGIPKKVIKKATEFEKIKLNEQFEFLSDDKPFSQIMIKNFHHNEIRFDGPANAFGNMSFLEFVFADTYFMKHMGGDENAKFKLIACLYRKQVINIHSDEYEGDTRERFSEHRIDQRANDFKKLDASIISGIVYNYRAVRQLVEDRYTYLFPKKENDSELEETPIPEPKKQNYNGWATTFKKFVDEDLINEDKYAIMLAHRVLEVINNRIKENIKNG